MCVSNVNSKIPVVLQTDIGGDIDDFWALVMLLKQNQLDLKMILTDTGNTVYRAALCAKLLDLADRTDVVVGAGITDWPDRTVYSQRAWVDDYSLSAYKNYTQDGVGRFIRLVEESPEPVTLIAIGPTTSLAEALRRNPKIAEKIHLKGMFGSIRKDYSGKPGRSAEYNIVSDTKAAQTVFGANWLSAAITPLDTCNFVRLSGDLYGRIEHSEDKLVKAIAEVYHFWLEFYAGKKLEKMPEQSSVLFDTVAVHMASSKEFLKFERLNLMVDDDGFTIENPNGKPFDCAMDWLDLDAYERFLTDTLTK